MAIDKGAEETTEDKNGFVFRKANQIIKSEKRDYSVPVSMLIQDNLRGKKIGDKIQYEKTQITIKNVKFEKVSDVVYTKPYLEMMSK